MIYVALDLARVSGAAWGPAFERPTFQTWTLGEVHSPLGARGVELAQRLRQLINDVCPGKVFIEAPMRMSGAMRKGSNADTLLQLHGLVFLAQTVCWKAGVECKLYERQAVLKHFTGQPRYKDSKDGKRACMTRIKQIWGVEVREDEADAGALLHYGCALNEPKAYIKARGSEPVMIDGRA